MEGVFGGSNFDLSQPGKEGLESVSVHDLSVVHV